MSVPDLIVPPLRDLAQLLVDKRYHELVASRGGEATAAQLALHLERYGVDLVSPPVEAFKLARCYETDADFLAPGERRSWTVDLPLWTRKGRSSLTMTAMISEGSNGQLRAEFSDVRVL